MQVAPARANASRIAAPMPRELPVTRTTLPGKRYSTMRGIVVGARGRGKIESRNGTQRDRAHWRHAATNDKSLVSRSNQKFGLAKPACQAIRDCEEHAGMNFSNKS